MATENGNAVLGRAKAGDSKTSRPWQRFQALVTGAFMAMSLFAAAATWAGELEDARAAMQRRDFATAKTLFQRLTEQGHADGKFGLAVALIMSDSGASDFAAGVRLLESAADAGSSDAQAFLAVMLLEGKKLPRDIERGVPLAKLSADAGNSLGKTVLAVAHLSGFGGMASDEKAVAVLSELPQVGNALVTYELGKATLVGRGIARNTREGERLLRSAASMLPERAAAVTMLIQRGLSLRYLREGTLRLYCTSLSCATQLGAARSAMKRDFIDGQWLELAARVSVVDVPSDLTYFYLGRAAEGLGDLNAAVIYYQLAALPSARKCDGFINNCDGFVFPRDASERLERVTAAVRAQEREEAERLAALEERRRQEAERAAIAAQERQRLEQEHRARELKDAFAAAERGALKGNKDDQRNLAEMYLNGTGVEQSTAKAMAWLKAAAKSGHGEAQYALGERYRLGADLPKDESAAEHWLRKAVAQGVGEAEEGLAEIEVAKRIRAIESAANARRLAAEREERERKRKLENVETLKSF